MWTLTKKGFRKWWRFYKARTALSFRKLWRGILILGSAYITVVVLVFSIFFPDWLLTMSIVLLVTIFVIIPITLIVCIFIYSLRPKWRKEIDKWIGYGELSDRKKLRKLQVTLKETKEILDKHIQENHPKGNRRGNKKRRKI